MFITRLTLWDNHPLFLCGIFCALLFGGCQQETSSIQNSLNPSRDQNIPLDRDDKLFSRTGKIFGDITLRELSGQKKQIGDNKKKSSILLTSHKMSQNQLLTTPFYSEEDISFNNLWHACLEVLKPYSLEILDQASGIIQTRWHHVDNAPKVRSQIRVHIQSRHPLVFSICWIQEHQTKHGWILDSKDNDVNAQRIKASILNVAGRK